MHGITTTPKSEQVFVEHVFEGVLSSAMQTSIGDFLRTPRFL